MVTLFSKSIFQVTYLAYQALGPFHSFVDPKRSDLEALGRAALPPFLICLNFIVCFLSPFYTQCSSMRIILSTIATIRHSRSLKTQLDRYGARLVLILEKYFKFDCPTGQCRLLTQPSVTMARSEYFSALFSDCHAHGAMNGTCSTCKSTIRRERRMPGINSTL